MTENQKNSENLNLIPNLYPENSLLTQKNLALMKIYGTHQLSYQTKTYKNHNLIQFNCFSSVKGQCYIIEFINEKASEN